MLATAERERHDPRLLEAARISARIFIDRFCWLQAREGGPPVPFRLWDLQVEALDEIETHLRLIVLKARQLGLSWLALAYALWLCLFNSGQAVLIYNRGLEEAIELLRRVKFMYDRLPAELQQPLVENSRTYIEFANGSRIKSLPGSEDAGSTYTATLVIMDEWAKIARARGLLNAALGTLSASGGKFVGISTAKGLRNLFAEIWKDSIIGANDYYPLFIPTTAHPDRDDTWRASKRREYKTDRDFRQEHPEEWKDAFQQPGDAVFDEFDRAQHHRHVPRVDQWPVWRGVDFGYHYSPVYWAEIQAERHVHVFAELDAQHIVTEELADQIVARDRDYGIKTSQAQAGVDPAGVAQTAQATESDHDVLRRHGIPVHDNRVAPKDRVGEIKKLLRENRLTIDVEACPYLAEALEQAQWDKTGTVDKAVVRETYEKDGYYEHPLDALGYMLVNVFPSTGAPAGAAAATAASPKDPYSSSDFG
jgi:hypothetical protein